MFVCPRCRSVRLRVRRRVAGEALALRDSLVGGGGGKTEEPGLKSDSGYTGGETVHSK